MTPLVDVAEFRRAMRLTASGVAVITTDGPAGLKGLTVSSLCSLSMEPPSVLACVNRGNSAFAALIENGRFTANILSADQAHVADAFAGLIPEFRENRFASAEWLPVSGGSPALIGALCSFDCRVGAVFSFGSHDIIAGEVIGLMSQEATPLLYANGSYQRSAAI